LHVEIERANAKRSDAVCACEPDVCAVSLCRANGLSRVFLFLAPSNESETIGGLKKGICVSKVVTVRVVLFLLLCHRFTTFRVAFRNGVVAKREKSIRLQPLKKKQLRAVLTFSDPQSNES
jgi:hypothetical protein